MHGQRMTMPRLLRTPFIATPLLCGLLLSACERSSTPAEPPVARGADQQGHAATAPSPDGLYGFTTSNHLSATVAGAASLVYVPNLRSNTVSVIDPSQHEVIRTMPVGGGPQHVVPTFDLTRLWVTNNDGNSLTPIDPETGMSGEPVPVDDPYNLYFTSDGSLAMVMAETRHRVDFRDPVTMNLVTSMKVSCSGIDHMDFTADGRFGIATCEYSGQLVKIDLSARQPVAYLKLSGESMPQDIRVGPDGRTFFVADMAAGGLRVIDPTTFTETGFIKTGVGTHGLVVGRGGSPWYVENRGWKSMARGRHGPGSITVVDPLGRKVLATWMVPGGGSPDMGNLSADGKELWVSGRYDEEVYVFDVASGQMTHRIPVGKEPHGLCVWPQPGRFSLGHTGNMR